MAKEQSDTMTQDAPPEPRSERGRLRRQAREITPIQEIRWRAPGVNGPWAYYLRRDGATIRDALILYPNGAQLPQSEDEKGRYSRNADYYQQRQARKGLEYLGPALTPEAVRKLVETLAANREDEILDLEDQIAECDYTIKNTDRPEMRDQQRKRKGQLQSRLERVSRELDPEALSAELNEIARAQRLSRVDPKVLEVMREMIGEVNDRMTKTVLMAQTKGRKQVGTSMGEDPDMMRGRDYIDGADS